MNDRQGRVLIACFRLTERGVFHFHPGQVQNEMGGGQRGGRRELGARNSLDALERQGLVRSTYIGPHATGRDYSLTIEGFAKARELAAIQEEAR